MSRKERSNIIRGLWFARVGVALTAGFIPTARATIRQETASITSTARAEMEDETRDETEIGWTSALPFDQIREQSEGDAILTNAERQQLKRDMWNQLDRDTTPVSLATS